MHTTEKDPALSPPAIVDPAADDAFKAAAAAEGIDPSDYWVDRYVDYEWGKLRPILEAYFGNVQGRDILEFGCNVGATAIVLAHMGARVTAIDVEEPYVRLATHNAQRYDKANDIRLSHVPDTRQLPFPAESFDLIVCNSVLEYVPADMLDDVLKEIDRVLKPDGHLVILGTSNRLWPVEVHERQWLVNYVPRAMDRLLGRAADRICRGVFPWRLSRPFRGYENRDLTDGGQSFLSSRARIGEAQSRLRIYGLMIPPLRRMGISLGQVLWNISLILRKPKATHSEDG